MSQDFGHNQYTLTGLQRRILLPCQEDFQRSDQLPADEVFLVEKALRTAQERESRPPWEVPFDSQLPGE